MKLRNFPALAATLFLGTAVLATDDALSTDDARYRRSRRNRR